MERLSDSEQSELWDRWVVGELKGSLQHLSQQALCVARHETMQTHHRLTAPRQRDDNNSGRR